MSGERGSGGSIGLLSAALPERERAVGEEGEGTDKRAPLVGEREGKGGERPAGWAAAQEGERGGE